MFNGFGILVGLTPPWSIPELRQQTKRVEKGSPGNPRRADRRKEKPS